MLPGKKYTPEDIVRILISRIWLLLLPAALIGAGTALYARKLPDRYRSDTLILVVPQRVPEAYVKSTVTARIEDRLNSISQQILSRTRLERVIHDFNLYAKARETGLMEDIVGRMRRDIFVDVVKGDAFRVSYVGGEPRTVMRVTERLASLFIEENLRDREVLAEGTNQFLESQLEDARRRLIEHEKKLEEYRRRHSGQLPEQLNSNVQMLQNTQLQIQNLLESINRDRDRRLVVERQLVDAQAEPPTPPPPVLQMASGETGTGGTTAQQIAQARSTLQALELRFKPGHPDIGIWQRRLRDLEKQAEAEALRTPVSTGSSATTASAGDLARQKRLGDLKAELDQLDRQISSKLADEQRLRAWAAGVQARVEATPTRQSEMIELTRDYASIQGIYSSLLNKKEDSRLAANLERRQIGEQFKLLDPARLPEKPVSPNRQRMNMIGLAAGLLIGLGLIAFLEYRDSSFKTDEEMTALLSLPVLAIVPSMRSHQERRAMVRRRIALGVGLGSTVTICLAVVLYTFVR